MSICLLRPEVFPQEIIKHGQHWPITNINLHSTCKWLYALWFAHLRERALKELLLRHAERHYGFNACRLQIYSTVQAITWGTVTLFSAPAFPPKIFTLCGKQCVVKGRRAPCCEAYTVIADSIPMHYTQSVILCKKDVIEGIEYRFTIPNTDPDLAVAQLYDCSLLQQNHSYCALCIFAYSPNIYTQRAVLYTGSLTFKLPMGPGDVLIDGTRVTTAHTSGTDLSLNSIVDIIMYMRSSEASHGPLSWRT